MKKEAWIKNASISLFLMIVYFKMLINSSGQTFISKFVGNYDIFIYCTGCLVFFISLYLLSRKRMIHIVDNHFYEIVVVFIGLFFTNDLYESSKMVAYQSLEESYYTCNKYLLCISVLVFAFFIYWINKNIQINSWVIHVVAFFVAAFSAFRMWSPNIAQNGYQIVHNSATYDQIYNLVMGEPYSETQYGIYGHYGVFYKLIFDLLHSFSINQYVFLQMILVAICVLLFSYMAICLIRNNSIKILTVYSLVLLWGSQMTPYTITYQAFIRLFPISIIGTFVVISSKSDKKQKYKIFGYILCALCIIWNTEFGLVGTIAVAYYFYEPEFFCGKKILSVLKAMFFVTGSFCLAYILFNLFNVFYMHGKIQSMDYFLIPYFSDVNYMTESLVLPLQFGNIPWIWICIMGIIIVSAHFAEYFLNEKCLQDYSAASTIAILTLGGLVYYINRSAAGCLWIVYPLASIQLGIIASMVLNQESNQTINGPFKCIIRQILEGTKVVVLVVVCGFIICGTLQLNGLLSKQRANKDVSQNEIDGVLLGLDANVPEGVPGLGEGIELIYSYAGRNDEYHMTSAIYMRDATVNVYEQYLMDGKPKVINKTEFQRFIEKGFLDSELEEEFNKLYKNQIHIGSVTTSEYWYVF